MGNQVQVGFWGVGVELPAQVRNNDWWPLATVRAWSERAMRKWSERAGRFDEMALELAADAGRGDASPNAMLVLQAIAEQMNDPFQGVVERRVAAPDVTASQLEAAAAKKALADAKVDAAEIDLLITYSLVPDYMCTPNAAAVHALVGLPEKCLSLTSDMGCNSFLTSVEVAQRMIASGAAKRALLVQSALLSRILPYDQPHSTVFGDGATAVVMGPVGACAGILGSAHRTDGRRHQALVAGVQGKRWYDEGRVTLYPENPKQASQMLQAVADRAQQIVAEALAQAGKRADDVDFYACHQGTAWIRRVTQHATGLQRARSVDTFRWAASLSAANLPLVLHTARAERLLRDGDLVAFFAGGTGETWSSLVARWGRG